MTISIRFSDVSKKFLLRQSRSQSWQETLLQLFSKRKQFETGSKSFWVLKNVSFEVYQGETLSLIGANGAGKSTLFKLLTRIIRPTSGTIEIQGRVSALLELGTGFHPDLTGRENIYLGGTLAGLSQAEVEQNVQAIIDFADIGQFIDAPVRHYSSGMFIRLGFALATHISPDILVVDEVLAVGDVSFQKKCLEKIHQMRQQGVTVILVSHDMSVVRAISDRVLWLKHGLVQAVGSPDEVIQAYLADQRAVGEPGRKLEKRGKEAGKIVEIESVEFLNGSGKPVLTLETGHEATIRINYLAHQRVEMPIFGLAIHSSHGIHVNGPNSDIDDFPIDFIEGRGAVEYQISFLPLLGGTYSITVGIFDRTTTITYDACDRTFSFVVKQGSTKEMYGLVYMPARWRHLPK